MEKSTVKWSKGVLALLMVVLLAWGASGCKDKKKKADEEVAAAVGKVKVLKKDVENRLSAIEKAQPQLFKGKDGEKRKKELEGRILDSMIKEELLIREAERLGAKLDEKELEKRAEALMKQIPEQMKKAQNITLDVLKENLRRQAAFSFLQQRFLKDVKVSKEEVKAYYDANKQQFPKETLEQATEKITRMLQGQKVAEKLQALAKELEAKAKKENK